MAVRPNTAGASAAQAPKHTSKPQVVTYQDYTLKQEKPKSKKVQISKEQTQTTFSSTPFSNRPKTASATQVIAKKPAIQNFMLDKYVANLDQDDSLLQDSQASKTRTEKQQILADQIAQRRQRAHEEARLKEEAAQKRLQNLNQLNQRFKAQAQSQAKLEKIRKSKERSQERSQKRKTAELVKRHAHLATAKTEGASKQLSDLRNWIDEQLTQEKLDQSGLDSSSEASEAPKGKENTQNQIKLKQVDVTDGNQLQALKHKLPGNSLLSEKEDSKIGVRANRYGVFKDGASDFDKVVQIQSQKAAGPVVYGKPVFSDADSKNVKKHAGQVLNSIAKKVGGYDLKELDQASEDDYDDEVPVKQPIVVASKEKQVRKVINQPAPIEDRVAASELPGVTNARSTQAKLDKMRREQEVRAVVVIQKFLRGHWGRRDAKKVKARRFKEIGQQYDHYQKEFKKNQEYDLQRYLKDKKKIRTQNGFESIEEITEEIGESIGSSNKFVSTALSAQFSNMFAKTAASSSDFDPLSLISIYAKRHAAPPPASKPPAKSKLATQVKQQDVIEESIQYSQSFEKASGSIPEDIPKASGSSAPSFKQPLKAKAIVQSDSIIDEIPSARRSDVKSDSIADDVPFAKPDSDSESIIEEESFLKEDYKQNNLKVVDVQKNLEARNRERFGVAVSTQDDKARRTVQVAEAKHDSDVRQTNAIGGLLQEMRAYEASNLSQVMVDRMEKIVVTSLAQKDQIIMAQRLGELERENRHKDEINRIREEQIRLMSQLMLLGTATQQHTNFSKQQRDEMLLSIQKIIEKPIEIKHETHVNYSMPESEISHHIRKENIVQPLVTKRQSYLEEYDQSKRSKFSNSKPVEGSDEIVDEVGSVTGDSIHESIEASGNMASNTYEDFKANQFKLAQDDSGALNNLISQLDRAIEKEKQQQQSSLQQSLRRKQISPRSFDRKRIELDRWATSERREVKEQHRTIAEEKNRKKKVELESMEDSDVKLALNQAHLIGSGLIGMSPDAKYIQRKKEAAMKLMNEKERVIQEQLNQKLKGLESDLANEVLQQALELDISKEVARRYEAAKKQIEESQGQESSRSALSALQKDAKVKKNVQFQQNVKPGNNRPAPGIQVDKVSSSGDNIEESIPESIRSQYSQSFNSASKSKSQDKPKTHKSQSEIDEKISEDYSDDNFNSSAAESESKGLGSRQKLQNKIKDIAESAQYSDDFDDNSISQSQGLPATGPAMVDKKDKKMESVLEESDSSHHRPSHSGSNLDKESSLPSEDVEVQDSARSVDWQINCPQDTNRTGDEFSDQIEQESIKEEESSLNDRLSDELESNPDQISGSIPDDNDFALADRIAKELMDILIQDYKDDQIFVVSKDRVVIDEEAFKNKFPYTLDKVEPERPIVIKQQQPESPKSAARTPQKAAPTAKELADKKFITKHEKEQEQLKRQHEKLLSFLDFLCKRVDINLLQQQLDKPVQQDPLVILAQIQAYEDEEPPQQPDLEIQQVLQQSFFNKIDREFCTVLRMKSNIMTEDISVSQEDRENIQNVHNYAVFEALNEALDSERPYKSKGEPMPWSKNTRAVKQATTPEMAKIILEKAKAKVIEWSQFGAGSKYAPLPPPPTQTQDEFGDEIQQPPLNEGEEERRNQQRQEKLGQLMTNDIRDTDCHWIDYEIEDTQVRFDLADMILADLAAEICQFLK